MRWGSIQAVQQLDRFVQRLRGVRQEQTPRLYLPGISIHELYKTYTTRAESLPTYAVRHDTCVSYAQWHGHEPTWPNVAPHSNVCRVGGREKKSYKLESSDAATYRVSESSLSIKHNHARVRVAYCSAFIAPLIFLNLRRTHRSDFLRLA